jgi:hypothetical protein
VDFTQNGSPSRSGRLTGVRNNERLHEPAVTLTQVQTSRPAGIVRHLVGCSLRPADGKLNDRRRYGRGILNDGEPALHKAVADDSAWRRMQNLMIRSCDAV